MSNTVQLKGLDLFIYLMTRFGNTPEQALKSMKEHGQDIKGVEEFMKFLNSIGGEVVTEHTFNKKPKRGNR